MRLKIIYSTFLALLVFALNGLFSAFSFGPAATIGMGYTGAPGDVPDMTCIACHTDDAFGLVSVDLVSNIGTLPFEFLVEYETSMDITINAASGSPAGYGFQLIMANDLGVPLDVVYSNLGANVKQTTLANGRTYLEHNGISASNVFSFDYNIVANSDVTNIVKVHVAATAVNSNGFNSEDSGSLAFEFTLLPFELPVELINFEANPKGTGIRLDWTTETEQDNDYFGIEHSTDGINFSTIKTIAGAGTSSQRHSYTYTHNNPVNGNNYYQLRQVDFDGKETLSEIVVAKFGDASISVFPQPASTAASVYLNSSANESGTMQVYDISGRLIHSNDIQLTVGDNYLDLNCENWIAGHYVIHLQSKQIGEEAIHFLKK